MTSTPRTSAEVLRAARARIEDPARWTQGDFARDCDGNPVSPENEEATCWCAVGALHAEGSGDFDTRPYGFLRKAAFQNHTMIVVGVNDSLGHAAVLRIYDRAIELAEAQTSDPVLAEREVGGHG